MSLYSPRRPLLGAFINGPSAQVFTSMLKREDVVRRSHGLPADIRSKLLDDWDAISEAAKAYKERCAENRVGAPDEAATSTPAEAPQDPDQVEADSYSVKTIAFVLGCTERWVRKLLESGELQGVKVHDRWRITEDSVSDYGMRQLLARQAS